MLNFFKKSGRSSSCDEKTLDKNKRNSMPSSSSLSSNDTFLDEDFAYDGNELIESRSRLSMNLEEILNDRNCLSYFIQYLEIKNALSLIKFYLDTESFKTVSENEYRKRSKSMTQSEEYLSNVYDNASQCDGSDRISISSSTFDISDIVSIDSHTDEKHNSYSSKFSNRSLNKVEEDISSVPELRTLCDLTMRKPLTDDEKSQIYAETNKRKLQLSFSSGCRMTESKTLDNITKRTSIGTDAIRIYRKYLISSSQYFIDIPTSIHSQISLALCSQDEDDANNQSFAVSSNCFNEAQMYIFNQLERNYLNDFLQHPFYCKYCVETLSSSNLKLIDILHSESALFYFMEYLEQENQQNCLEFWIAAWNFRKHYETMDLSVNTTKTEAQNDSMILYEKYFSLQAACPLRISNSIRSHVEESICSENDCRLISRCFDLPLKIIEKYLEDKYFKDFLNSQLFNNYLNELKSKIQDSYSNEEIKTNRKSGHRKTRSDCSHENTKNLRNGYISQQNTLLAMESSNLNPKLKKLSNINNNASSDMHIDSKQLTNPDLLWHRNSTSGLTFGRVDSMGRYERDFDVGTPEGKWSFSGSGNKFKNAVRKLVNLPEDRVQEEIAWQVAEMIVNDVTSITLKSRDAPSK